MCDGFNRTSRKKRNFERAREKEKKKLNNGGKRITMKKFANQRNEIQYAHAVFFFIIISLLSLFTCDWVGGKIVFEVENVFFFLIFILLNWLNGI